MKWDGTYPEPYVEPATPGQRAAAYLGVIVWTAFWWAVIIGGVLWIRGWFN